MHTSGCWHLLLAGKVWIGLSRFAGNWYWTYYNAMKGSQTTFTFWGIPPETGTQLVADLNSMWRAVKPSEQHFVMCEEEDDWPIRLAGKYIILSVMPGFYSHLYSVFVFRLSVDRKVTRLVCSKHQALDLWQHTFKSTAHSLDYGLKSGRLSCRFSARI